MKTKRYLAGLLCSALLASAPAALATSFEPTTFSDTVAAAQLSVIGEVKSINYERRQGQIVTITTYSVEFPGFGRAAGQIDVVTPGGRMELGGFPVAEVVAGAPRTVLREKALLLLTFGDTIGEFRPVGGFSAGIIPVHTSVSGTSRVMLPASVGGMTDVKNALEIVRELKSDVRLDTGDLSIEQ